MECFHTGTCEWMNGCQAVVTNRCYQICFLPISELHLLFGVRSENWYVAVWVPPFHWIVYWPLYSSSNIMSKTWIATVLTKHDLLNLNPWAFFISFLVSCLGHFRQTVIYEIWLNKAMYMTLGICATTGLGVHVCVASYVQGLSGIRACISNDIPYMVF